MSIEFLTNVLVPPAHPLCIGSADDWAKVEESLGGALPADYKDIIATYGVGCIDGFLWVRNPFTQNENLNLFKTCERIFHSFQIRRDASMELPFPLFPEENGIFPWAGTDNGDMMFWRFRNGRFQQPLIVMESRGPDWQEFDLSSAQFLADTLSRRISVRVFPDEFPSDRPEFLPDE